MKILNKTIFLLMIILEFMIIISTFVSAATLDNSTSLEQDSTDTQVKLIQKEINSVIDSGLLTSPTILDINCRLEYGSKGEQVKLLQKELNSVMNAGLTVDGSFGSKTKNAVLNFQKKYGLEVDGIVGIATAGQLNVVYLANTNYVIVNDDDLNVRTEPSANSTKLGTIYMGDAYATYGTATASNGKTWYKIKYNGQDAYISASYVTQNGIFLDLSEQTLRVYKDGKLELVNDNSNVQKFIYDFTPLLMIICVILVVIDVIIRKLTLNDIKALFRRKGYYKGGGK